jgi:hypothetical protein
MIFSLDVRRARKGDCLLLHFGTPKEPGLVMIDGGPKAVYGPSLKPRLQEIRAARKLDKNQSLPVDVLMVSHVDDDHIQGILDLTRELLDSVGAPLVRVASLWHNSFDDIIGKDPKELTAAMTAQFGAASLEGELPDDATVESSEDEETVRSSLKVLASIEQGHRLRDDASNLDHRNLGFRLNAQFNGRLIMAAKRAVTVGNDLKCTVAGPMKPELQALQEKHDQWLKQQQKTGKPAEASLAAYVDPSVPNLSSIVVLAAFRDKRILLTGDARGDKILEGLELSGVLKKRAKMHVDVLKVPHHGSSNNLEVDFFERITADHYVFSGDGEHGNPERESLEMLFKARGTAKFQIHLTYPIDEVDVARAADWKKEQVKEQQRKAAGSKKSPRPNWSSAKQSLAAFFKARKIAAGQKISISDPVKPHVIDLLDPLGY